MHSIPHSFDTPAGLSIEALFSKLSESLTLQSDSESNRSVSIIRTFYDSFDWRLYASGYQLFTEQRAKQISLSLHALHESTKRLKTDIDQLPKFWEQLPEGLIKQTLAPILEMRALLPQIQIECSQQHIKQLNKDEKTVLRFVVEKNRLKIADSTEPFSSQIHLYPLRGYDKAHKKTVQLIESDLGFVENQPNLLEQALAVNHRKPMDYSSKLNIQLTVDMHSGQSCRLILKDLLAAMLINEEGTCKDIDSEFLHDFRVAIRRTRSALSQLKSLFPSEEIVPFVQAFTHLGEVTSPTRDLDVYLLDFNTYKASLPVSMREDLDPLHTFLQKQQKNAHRTLVGYLSSDDYRNLMDDWQHYLQTPLPDNPYLAVPVLKLANTRIWKVYRRVLKEGRAIDAHTEAEALHDLRKTCKKLRYLMEFFQTIYSPKVIKALIKALKGLQDNLGRHQDFEVQAATIKQFAISMAKSGTPTETLMAMGVLAQGLDQRRQQARDEFSQRFAEFDTIKLHTHFENLFKRDKNPWPTPD